MKKLLLLIVVILSLPVTASAMHIAEGFLPLEWCAIWALALIPFVAIGLTTIKNMLKEQQGLKLLYAVAAAFVFILSSLKMPSVAGSSSHMTGIALGAILFGAYTIPVISVIVLLFQALLLAHGGITTIGANAFSMGVVGPFIAVWVFQLFCWIKAPKWVGVFFAALISDMSIYFCTSLQLSLAFQSNSSPLLDNLYKFLSVFAISQIPLAIVEGVLTVMLLKLILRYQSKEERSKIFAHV